jgi:hypothetical protein
MSAAVRVARTDAPALMKSDVSSRRTLAWPL